MLKSSRRRMLAGRCFTLFLLLTAAPLYAQFDPANQYRQSEAVKTRYPDPPVSYRTPGFRSGRTDFTTNEEMLDFVYKLQARAANLQVRVAGRSQEGRPIPLLVLSNSGFTSTIDLVRLGRPVVLLVGLQHGNEPAGGEAMLVLAEELAVGRLRPLLDRLTVLILPHNNPDGAHWFRRSPHGTVDINRDHVKVELPETAALHRVVNEFQPHVFVDAHEFSVAARWIDKFGVIQAQDLLLQHATHPAVPAALTGLAERVFLPALRRDIERAGYSHFWYYTTSYNMKDLRVSMGGTAPDIGRNFAGLQNAVSFLIETRGVGIGRDSFARRVHGHVVSLTTVLETAAGNARAVMQAVHDARAEAVRRGRDPDSNDRIPVTLRSPIVRQTLAMLDPVSGEPRTIEVDWSDSLAVEPVLTRSRPFAYLLPAHMHSIAERLMRSGIDVRRLRTPASIEVERFEVTERRPSATFVEGLPLSSVSTEVTAVKRVFPAGTYAVVMAQPNAAVIAAALEPESPSSFVSFGLIPVDRRGAPSTIAAPSEVPTFRVLHPTALDLEMVGPR
jgi:hypothetical protein